jgi:3-hydroxy-9,10-secoandrosta-1,3,5(10)-triene-9,17-dione monooxygenase
MQASLLKESETAPTLESLIAAVDRLGPTLRARAAEAEGQRQLPAETIRDLFDAGVLRFFIPRRFGGHELEWGGHLALGRRLAHHCASTAWISCVVGSHATYVGRMDPRAQQDVWGSDPDILVATGSVSRNVSVEAVEGGFRISGRWSFCSGIDHAGWALLRASPTGDQRQTYFLFPRSDFRIDDDWFVSGMSGTGSKSAIVDNAFVPTYRTLPLGTLMAPEPPGGAVNPGYIYKYNFRPFSGANLLGPIIGGAEAVVAAYRDLLEAGTPGQSKDDVQTQLRLAESEAEVGAALCLMDSLVARLQDYGRNNIDVPHPERIGFVRDRTFAARLCFNAAERLVTSLDQSVVLSEHPIQRCFRDLGGMIQQIGVNWDRNMTDVIKASFGRQTNIPFLNTQ